MMKANYTNYDGGGWDCETIVKEGKYLRGAQLQVGNLRLIVLPRRSKILVPVRNIVM